MASLFSHLWMFLTHVYNFKYVFNSTVIKLSWHVLCYLISKNLYLLQNAQPFIFQLICIQLCKCINCFLKPHNKQLNQYCLNFTIFFLPKKKKILNGFGSGLGLGRVDPQKPRVGSRVNLFLLHVKKKKKNRVWIGYFSGWVGKILTHSTMSSWWVESHVKPR